MHYSLEQLEVFVLATQAGGFTAAARRIGKTQSTISTAIANLPDYGDKLSAIEAAVTNRTSSRPPSRLSA